MFPCCTIDASIELAAKEVNSLRGKLLQASGKALKHEYERQWRASRAILATLYAMRRAVSHPN